MTEPSSRPWARHFQDDWQARAGDPRMPYWLRVASLAYGSHEDNGHARFKRGEISLILASVDKETGAVTPYRHVGRSIDDAIEYGWLELGSFWGCLIVPAHSVKKGAWKTSKPCPIHVKRTRTSATNTPLSGDFGSSSSPPDGVFSTRTRHSVATSERNPFFLICPPQPPQEPQPDKEAS